MKFDGCRRLYDDVDWRGDGGWRCHVVVVVVGDDAAAWLWRKLDSVRQFGMVAGVGFYPRLKLAGESA